MNVAANRHPVRRTPGESGFSLLEVLVAFSIMAMSLAVLYQIVGGSVRLVSDAETRVKAIILAESVLALHDTVPAVGLDLAGTDGGFEWRLRSQLEDTEQLGLDTPLWELHRIDVVVSWSQLGRERVFELSSLRPGELETP